MEQLETVFLTTVVVAVLCISFSTWITLSDLRAVVFENDALRPVHVPIPGGALHSFAHHAAEHLPHAIRLPGSAAQIQDTAQSILPSVIDSKVGKCYVQPHTDYYGEAVKYGPINPQVSAAACCESCLRFRPASKNDSPCNVWVWCGDKKACGPNYQHCWLKYMPWLYSSRPKQGPEVPWTSGVTQPPPAAVADSDSEHIGASRKYHTVTTASGSSTHWQMRVHYYWFMKQKKKCIEKWGKDCPMGGFTRLLHSGQDDDLSAEIPTHVVQPLPKGPGNYVVCVFSIYLVLNRPYAFLQWAKDVQIKEKYVLMSEPDHLFMKPIPNLMKGDDPAAFPFFYIEPSKKEFVDITRKFIGMDKTRKDCEKVPPIGSSPTFLRFDDLQKITGAWEWGWVMEMYAFTISLYNYNVLPVSLHLELAAQPPWDTTMDMNGIPFYMLHFTYGNDYTLEGEFTPGKIGAWRFDKRSYHHRPPPRNLSRPPVGMKNDLVRFLIDAINEATSTIPGWDEYARTGVATEFMKYEDLEV